MTVGEVFLSAFLQVLFDRTRFELLSSPFSFETLLCLLQSSLKAMNSMKSSCSLPEMNSPSNLRHLEIKECQALPFLPDGLMPNENLPLEFLVIDGCSSLESFPDGDLPLNSSASSSNSSSSSL
ncbi:hypothetical protein Dsin_032257 [Dipteronia sinensis]|uniref:Uncharacterized protein n=1 Tax=Dipteronia sinensis TaxID=43782 RepID=A0AAD9ZML6_9ROSI|nr:hypothetical protein Dsin_032257 [Dipteronia sinensis]